MKITDATIGIRAINLDNGEVLTQVTCYNLLAKFLSPTHAAEIAPRFFDELEMHCFVPREVTRYKPATL